MSLIEQMAKQASGKKPKGSRKDAALSALAKALGVDEKKARAIATAMAMYAADEDDDDDEE